MGSMRPPKPVSEWADPRQRRGYAGERAAMRHLLRHGYRIEAHRFRLGHHDLDLVARQGNVVVFVEVKTRGSLRFGRPVEAVGRRKRSAMARMAEVWRIRFGQPEDRYRFDVISVEPEGVTHIQDAWRGVEK
jgi:putative endonuclease